MKLSFRTLLQTQNINLIVFKTSSDDVFLVLSSKYLNTGQPLDLNRDLKLANWIEFPTIGNTGFWLIETRIKNTINPTFYGGIAKRLTVDEVEKYELHL